MTPQPGGSPRVPGGSAKTLNAQRPTAALSLVRSHYAELPGALRRVAETVLLDPPAAAGGTIVELAERSGTSVSTVTRFCRAIGFVGFAGLRLGLRDGGSTSVSMAADPLARLLEQIVADDMIAVRETATLLDLSAVARAADMMSRARRVEVYAAAGSAVVGELLRECLTRLGVPQHKEPTDVAMGISRSGDTLDTVDRLAKARARGAKTIALTSFAHSPLAEHADILLLTTTLRPQALSARHPQLVVLDLLGAAVAQRIQGAR